MITYKNGTALDDDSSLVYYWRCFVCNYEIRIEAIQRGCTTQKHFDRCYRFDIYDIVRPRIANKA